jgi:hypothetical protein
MSENALLRGIDGFPKSSVENLFENRLSLNGRLQCFQGFFHKLSPESLFFCGTHAWIAKRMGDGNGWYNAVTTDR